MDYQQIVANVVVPKINEFGATRQIERNVNTTTWIQRFDPVESAYIWENTEDGEITDEQPETTLETYDIVMLENEFKKNEIDGNLIQKGDKRFYLKPTFEPYIDDIIIDNDKRYRVYNVMQIKPASIVLLYEVWARNHV